MIDLGDEFRERLSTALMDGYPVVVSTVDADGRPHLSFYGTTRVFDGSPEVERNQDPERTGIAVVIVLSRVRGRGFVWKR